MGADGIEIVEVGFDDPAAVDLVTRLDAELHDRYGDDPVYFPRPEAAPLDFLPPHGAFVLALDADGHRPVGCGGLRRWDRRSAEVKRMYVAPEGRGRGVGRRILAALEEAAGALGYHEVRLETGVLQAEAMALYSSAGYERMPCYGEFEGKPKSVCYRKAIVASS